MHYYHYRAMSQDLIFIPIRDATGTTQLVFRSGDSQLRADIQKLTTESVICAEGIVRKRPEEMINKHQSTGAIEVEIDKIYCLNPASTSLPFWPSQPLKNLVRLLFKR